MKRALPILLTLTLASCATRFTNVRRLDLDQQDPKALVVIDDSPSWSALGYVDNKNQLHVIRAQLDVLGEIRHLYPSPDRSKLMVESYGEGHQFLSVFLIDKLIADHKKSKGFIDAYRTLDPYPDGFWDISWTTDGCIRFSARADMRVFDADTRRGKTTMDETIDVERVWIWHLDKDSFEMAPDKL